MPCVDSTSVQKLQLRAPAASKSDRRAIRLMFSEGVLFPKLTDLDLRRRVQERIMSLDVVIPSVETFHENMKYLMIGARILRRYIMDEKPQEAGPGDVYERKRTLFERLSENWTAPPVQYVEVGVDQFEPLAVPRPTAHLAYLHVLVAALRHFACLDDVRPRQDRRGEKMPAGPVRSWVVYLLKLAKRQGFDSQKIRDGLAGKGGKDCEESFEPKKGVLADWRAGTPFTKTYLSLQKEAFLHKLADPIPNMDKPTPAYIFKDTLNAFFVGFGSVVTQRDVDASMQTRSTDTDTRAPPETLAPNADHSASSQPAGEADDEMEDAGGEPPDAPLNVRHAASGPTRTAKKTTGQVLKKKKDKPEHARPEKVVETLLHKKTRHALGSILEGVGISVNALDPLPPSPPSDSPRGTAIDTNAPMQVDPISGPTDTSEHNQIQSELGTGGPPVDHGGVLGTITHKATRHALGTPAVFPESLPLPDSPLAQNITSTGMQGTGVVDDQSAAPVNKQNQSLHVTGTLGPSVGPGDLAETIVHSTTRHALGELEILSRASATPLPPSKNQANRRVPQSSDNNPLPTQKPQAKIQKANRLHRPKKSDGKLQKAPGDREELPDAFASPALRANTDVFDSQIQDTGHTPTLIIIDHEPTQDFAEPPNVVPATNMEGTTDMSFDDSSPPVIHDSVLDVPTDHVLPERESMMVSNAIGETSLDFDTTQMDAKMTNGNDRQVQIEQKLKEKKERRKNAAVKANVSKQASSTSTNTLPPRRGKRVPIPDPSTELLDAAQAASNLPMIHTLAQTGAIQPSANADLPQATIEVPTNVPAMANGLESSQLPQTAENVLTDVGQAVIGIPVDIGQLMADDSTTVESPQPTGSAPAAAEPSRASMVFGKANQSQFAPLVPALVEYPPSPGATETLPSTRHSGPAQSGAVQPIRRMKSQRPATSILALEGDTTSPVADNVPKPSTTESKSLKRDAVYINPKRKPQKGGPLKKLRYGEWRADEAIHSFETPQEQPVPQAPKEQPVLQTPQEQPVPQAPQEQPIPQAPKEQPVLQISQEQIQELRSQMAAAPAKKFDILAKKIKLMLTPFYTDTDPTAASKASELILEFQDDIEELVNMVSDGARFGAYLGIAPRVWQSEPLAPENNTADVYKPEDVEELDLIT